MKKTLQWGIPERNAVRLRLNLDWIINGGRGGGEEVGADSPSALTEIFLNNYRNYTYCSLRYWKRIKAMREKDTSQV